MKVRPVYPESDVSSSSQLPTKSRRKYRTSVCSYRSFLLLLLGLVAGCVLFFYDHVQDTGVSSGRKKVSLKDGVNVKSRLYVNEAQLNAELVKVAQRETLCRVPKDRKQRTPSCKVLIAYENFAGRISKSDYEKALNEAGLKYTLLDKPGGLFREYTAEMAWDPSTVTASNYRSLTFHHEDYGEVNLWMLAQWAVCARQERSVAEIEADPQPHLDTIRDELYQYAAFIEWAIKQLEAFTPSVVIVAQGHYHFGAGVRAAAILMGLQAVALETPINNRRLAWSTISGISVDRGIERNLYWRYAEFVKPKQAEAEVQRYLRSAKASKMLVHASPEDAGPLAGWLQARPPGTRTLAFLAQVYTDTASILNIAAGFTSQAHAIWTVAKWCADNAQPLVIKFHPRETPPKDMLPIYGPRLNHLTLRRLRELYDWDGLLANHSGLILADSSNSIDTFAVIDACDAVVTINSGAGLEALLKGKEVILTGNAFYGGLGFTHQVESPASLTSKLAEVLQGPSLKLNRGPEPAKFFFVFNRWATIPKKAQAVVERACGFPDRWPLPKSQLCEDDDGDNDLGTWI
mmetsp:Transcript_23789/g.56703  ORF Transcript_23789/g.56703 Transcript_23789/m.56703 type:complete len:574 (+) Transcript_23789:290-2011(+)